MTVTALQTAKREIRSGCAVKSCCVGWGVSWPTAKRASRSSGVRPIG